MGKRFVNNNYAMALLFGASDKLLDLIDKNLLLSTTSKNGF